MSLWIGTYLARGNSDFRALDSLKAGRRAVEAKYAVIRHEVRDSGFCY